MKIRPNKENWKKVEAIEKEHGQYKIWTRIEEEGKIKWTFEWNEHLILEIEEKI